MRYVVSHPLPVVIEVVVVEVVVVVVVVVVAEVLLSVRISLLLIDMGTFEGTLGFYGLDGPIRQSSVRILVGKFPNLVSKHALCAS